MIGFAFSYDRSCATALTCDILRETLTRLLRTYAFSGTICGYVSCITATSLIVSEPFLMTVSLNQLSIRGFKSIRELKALKLSDLNVIIGANGVGKSNLVQVFKMLMAMERKTFAEFIQTNGGSDNFLYNGPKVTEFIAGEFQFGRNSYKFKLQPTVDEIFLIEEHRRFDDKAWRSYGPWTHESRLQEARDESSSLFEGSAGIGHYVHQAISNWLVYHFHDTSSNAPMRRTEIVEDHERLRKDGSNIAPVLLHLRDSAEHRHIYREIVSAIRLILPMFDDFRLDVSEHGWEQRVRLSWNQKGSDFPLQAYHLSDGSIRFICLATALLQPNPPSTLIIDEPELGLHPEALRILGELIKDASKRMQIILATQSPLLLDQFEVNDIIVATRNDGQSTFQRLNEADFTEWLNDYTIGELWVKNVIEGGTQYE